MGRLGGEKSGSGPEREERHGKRKARTLVGACPYLLAIYTPIVGLDHDISLPGDVDARALDLLDITRIFVGTDDLFELLGFQLCTGRGQPRARGWMDHGPFFVFRRIRRS